MLRSHGGVVVSAHKLQTKAVMSETEKKGQAWVSAAKLKTWNVKPAKGPAYAALIYLHTSA